MQIEYFGLLCFEFYGYVKKLPYKSANTYNNRLIHFHNHCKERRWLLCRREARLIMARRKNNYTDYSEDEDYEMNEDYYENYENEEDEDDDKERENYNYCDDVDDETDEDENVDTELTKKGLTLYDKNNPVDFFQIVADYHSGNPYKEGLACEKAVNSLEGLIRHIINTKFARYRFMYDDMLQQGRLAVCIALPDFNPEKSKPSTFFFYYIQHEIQDLINSQVNKTTAHYDINSKKIKKVIEEYVREGRKYTATDIAIDTKLPMQTIEQALNLLNTRETSYEGAVESAGGLDPILPSDEKSPEQWFIEMENVRALDKAMHNNLDLVETRVIEMTYGINGSNIYANKEISKVLKIPSDRVRRILVSAQCKLRQSKELKSIHADMLKDNIIEINEEDAVPLLSDIDLDEALEILKCVDIDF